MTRSAEVFRNASSPSAASVDFLAMLARTTLALTALAFAAWGQGPSVTAPLDAHAPHAPSTEGRHDYEDLRLVNDTGGGSDEIPVRVYRPRERVRTGPAPSLVFLHGRAQLGRDYAALAEHFSDAGYFVFLLDSARFDVVRIGDDAIAFFALLRRENARADSPLSGQLDMQRVGLLGHSWGGANVYRVLAQNPGYRLGVCFAPHAIDPTFCAAAAAPILTIVGRGDTITPASIHARPNYDAHSSSKLQLKVLHVLREACNHANVVRARYRGAELADKGIFARSIHIARSFCSHWLQEDRRALAAVVSPEIEKHPMHAEMHVEARRPQLFESGRAQLGQTARVHLVSAAGLAFHMYAYRGDHRPTRFGTLRLDYESTFVPRLTALSRTGVATHAVPIPDHEALVGLELFFQGISFTEHGAQLTPQSLHWPLERARGVDTAKMR